MDFDSMAEAEEEVLSDASDDDDFTEERAAVGDEADASGLSYVGEAAWEALKKKDKMRGVCWQVTHGKIVGEIAQTPPGSYWADEQIGADLETSHSDSFPERMGDIISRAEQWVDITSLGPPDGKFVDTFAKALKAIHDSGNSVTVRILFGNIIGMPTDCDAVTKAITKHPDYEIPDETSIKLWVSSWRKGVSWNHAKIIAVDGKYLFTGGHNLWDPHYMQKNPVRDLSCEAEGQVTHDGHVFANKMWQFVKKKSEKWYRLHVTPDWVPTIMTSRCNITKWPGGIGDYPPNYEPSSQPLPLQEAIEQGDIPIITCGRYGALHHDEEQANPSDSAIVAMLASAQSSIKMSLQDLGPLAVPPPIGPLAIPSGVWPEDYLREIGLAIYERGVDVHIVLSNPNSIPSDLGATEANYGNGWTCEDVASEIVKAIQRSVEDADEERIRGLVGVNLKLAFMRASCGECDWCEAGKTGNHAKFFIIDERCYYIGSQNLYIANLAEWGLIVDNEEQTARVMEEYWNRAWASSYENVPEEERDCNVDAVMDGAGIDRICPDDADLSPEQLEAICLAKKGAKCGGYPNNLMVWVKRASNLADADGLGSGSSDSYVKLRLIDGDGGTVSGPMQTKVIWDGGKNPEWNEVVEFEGLQAPCSYTLKLSVLDKDSLLGLGGDVADFLAADDKLGSATVDLGTLENSKSYQERELVISDGWFKDSTLTIALNTRGNWGN